MLYAALLMLCPVTIAVSPLPNLLNGSARFSYTHKISCKVETAFCMFVDGVEQLLNPRAK